MKIVTVEKKLVDKLVEECTENVEEVKLAKITSAEHKNMCNSSGTIYVVLFSIIFTINIGIGTCFDYFQWYLKKDVMSLVPIPKQQFNEFINEKCWRS